MSQPADGLAFEARLAGEARLFERTMGCRVMITGQGERRDLPEPVEDLLIDAALEGLRNAVKYGRAQAAVLHLAYQRDAIALVLQAGTRELRHVSPAAADHGGTGAGLAMLRQRVAQFHGTLELTCDQAGQTVLRVELPTRPFWRSPP